jgi:hypothetical protein
MVIGLAPIFIFWKKEVPTIAFYLSVLSGIFFGIALLFNLFPEDWFWTKGKYNDLLWVNTIGSLVCFTLFLGSSQLYKWIKK